MLTKAFYSQTNSCHPRITPTTSQYPTLFASTEHISITQHHNDTITGMTLIKSYTCTHCAIAKLSE